VEGSGDEVYKQRVSQFVGAYATSLGGIDRLVFTGTVAERSPAVREKITKKLKFLNIKNVSVFPTDEMAEIASATLTLLWV